MDISIFSRHFSELIKVYITAFWCALILFLPYYYKYLGSKKTILSSLLIKTLLVGTVLLSFLGYSRVLNPNSTTKSAIEYVWKYRVDGYDLVHYYLNVKYFQELSYFKLYPNMISADLENGGPYHKIRSSRRFIVFQDQWDYFWVDSNQYFNDTKWQDQNKKDFSPVRWQDFTKDFLSLHRGEFAGISERVWNDILWDHGFNGTPAWVFSVHWFVKSFPVEKLKLLCYVDCIWLLAALGAVVWCYGFIPACFLLIFLFTSYSMRWPTLSWAFGRHDFLSMMIISLCLLKKNCTFLAGIFGAWAGCLRIFPWVFQLGVGVNLLKHRILLTKYVLGSILVITILWGGAYFKFGAEPIKTYFTKMSAHTTPMNLSSMRQGFALALAYDADVTTQRMNASRRQRVEDQTPIRILLSLVLCSVFWFVASKISKDESYALGVIPFFLLLTASYYYMTVRALAIIVHSSKMLESSRHRVGLGFLFFIEATSNFLVTTYPMHRVLHIGALCWLLLIYVFIQTFWIIRESKAASTLQPA